MFAKKYITEKQRNRPRLNPKYKIALAVTAVLGILVIGVNLYKQNQEPIFEIYVAADTNNPYYDSPSCYDKSWYAVLEKADNRHYCLNITQGNIRTTDDTVNFKYGLKFSPTKETETAILSNDEYEKFEREFDYIQKNYKRRFKDEMYSGFYEGTRWYICIKGKYYSSASEKKGDDGYSDLMEDNRVSRDFFELLNSYMTNPPLVKPWE